MATPTTAAKIKLKLVINKKAKKVLFAEAGKDFVDFLFTLLSLPLATVIKLLTKNRMVGCLGNLYQSIEELSETFIQSSTNKDSVLNPKVYSPTTTQSNKLFLTSGGDSNGGGISAANRKVYMCPNNHRNVADNPRTICPRCNRSMRYEASFIASKYEAEPGNSQENKGGGFVTGVVTYMVMDNLEVRPMSNISTITLLKEFNIQQVNALEEKVIEVGMDEGLKLLKASMQSRTVLTNVLLRGWLG